MTKIAVTSSPQSGDTYGPDEKIEVTVTFSEAMTVTGVPFVRLRVGGSVQPADYASGSGSAALVFAYTVEARDKDTDGVSIPESLIIKAGPGRHAVVNDPERQRGRRNPESSGAARPVFPQG